MQPNLVLVGSILRVYKKRWYFHTPHRPEKLKFQIILYPERNILIWSAWTRSSVSAKRNYVNVFWAKRKMRPYLVLVGSILRLCKKIWYFHTQHVIEKLKYQFILSPTRLSKSKLPSETSSVHTLVRHQGRAFWKISASGNDPLPLSPLSVRNLLISSRTPPFDLIGLRYLSQSSHVKT